MVIHLCVVNIFLFHNPFKFTYIQFVSQKFHIWFLPMKETMSFAAICHNSRDGTVCLLSIHTSWYHRNLSWIYLFRNFRRNSKINSLKCVRLHCKWDNFWRNWYSSFTAFNNIFFLFIFSSNGFIARLCEMNKFHAKNNQSLENHTHLQKIKIHSEEFVQ